MKKVVCALTGHRILPADFDEAELHRELEILIKGGCNAFLCGMAEGFDLLCLRLLIKLKEKYSFTVEACVPFVGQETYFSKENKRLYRELLKKCDDTTTLLQSYQSGCYFLRNRYMVDSSDFVFAYCTKSTGGTVYTVGYAKRKNKTVVRVFSELFQGRNG